MHIILYSNFKFYCSLIGNLVSSSKTKQKNMTGNIMKNKCKYLSIVNLM